MPGLSLAVRPLALSVIDLAAAVALYGYVSPVLAILLALLGVALCCGVLLDAHRGHGAARPDGEA